MMKIVGDYVKLGGLWHFIPFLEKEFRRTINSNYEDDSEIKITCRGCLRELNSRSTKLLDEAKIDNLLIAADYFEEQGRIHDAKILKMSVRQI